MQKHDVRLRFGSAVKAARNQMKISQDELAYRAGLHRTYVSDIERGARNLSLASIEKLAAALEVSVPRLFNTGVSDTVVNILMIEDNHYDVELALGAFERAKCTNRIHVAQDGVAALEHIFGPDGIKNSPPGDLPRELPGLILLDLHLPKISGLEVLRRLKADYRTRSIPVVILTASQKDRDIAECRRLGVHAYIVKPVDLQGLSRVTPDFSMHWALLGPGANGASA
jgi:CheY-like chemotaxis protein